MTTAVNCIVESLKNIVKDIIEIPQEGYFSEKINILKTTINVNRSVFNGPVQ